MNSLCRRCEHWGDEHPDHPKYGYCHLKEKQNWFGKKEDEPRAALHKQRPQGPIKNLEDRDRLFGPWECDAFEERMPDWRHA